MRGQRMAVGLIGLIVLGLLPTPDVTAATRKLSITDVQVNESSSVATFRVALNKKSKKKVKVSYATTAGSAAAGDDYTGVTGQLVFKPGKTKRYVSVPISADALDEDDETFTVGLSAPVKAVIADASGTGTILDDEALPELSVSNESSSEGNADHDQTHDVTLSAASGRTVQVAYATTDGSAESASDYGATSGTLTFTPGDVTEWVSVSIEGDPTFEGDEGYAVVLSAESNATIFPDPGIGTIVNDDAAPAVSIGDVTANEGTGGTTSFTFPVTLSTADFQPFVTVNYSMSNGTAQSGADYTSSSSTLQFNPGDTTENIVVPIATDALDENGEQFTVTLFGAVNATILDETATGTIVDDDPFPTMAIGDVLNVNEGGTGGITNYNFPVTLSAASGKTVTVQFATIQQTATQGSDYNHISGTLTFVPGDTLETISVAVNGDNTVEADETFIVQLSNLTNAAFDDDIGQGEIQNDDP